VDRLHGGSWRALAAIAAATAIVVGACSSASSAPPSKPAVAASAAAASAAAGGTGKPLFVAINKSADQQYFITLQQAFKAEIEKLGGQAKLYNAKLDPNLGFNEVNDAIAAGAKGIAITVPAQTIGPAIATATKNAGVALVITDDVVKDAAGNQLPFVGFSGTDMGNKVGSEAGQLLTQAGWLKDSSKTVGVLAAEVQTLSVCNDRTNAEIAQIESAGVPAANVYPVPYDGTTPAAQNAAGPVTTAHPNVTNWIVFDCNDEGVLGVLNALSTAGVAPSNIIAVGLGAYLACVPWHANQPSGFKAALYLSGADVGTAAADELWNHVMKGQPLPANTIVKTTIVTPQNYATVIRPGDAPACFK
jgi:L-arabinose transport system substrate-binding protein